jgi:chaperonin GroES
MEMTVKPLADRVLVKPMDALEEKSSGGIIIPDTAKEKPMQGEIMEVGTGRQTEEGKLIPMTVAKGNKVLYGKYSGTEIKIDGDDMLIMRESDVLAIVE